MRTPPEHNTSRVLCAPARRRKTRRFESRWDRGWWRRRRRHAVTRRYDCRAAARLVDGVRQQCAIFKRLAYGTRCARCDFPMKNFPPRYNLFRNIFKRARGRYFSGYLWAHSSPIITSIWGHLEPSIFNTKHNPKSIRYYLQTPGRISYVRLAVLDFPVRYNVVVPDAFNYTITSYITSHNNAIRIYVRCESLETRDALKGVRYTPKWICQTQILSIYGFPSFELRLCDGKTYGL